jgi:hypothetical protein
MSSPESIPPIHRVTARVLPVNAAGEVLLLQAQDPAHPGDLHGPVDIMVSAVAAVAGGAR